MYLPTKIKPNEAIYVKFTILVLPSNNFKTMKKKLTPFSKTTICERFEK